MQWDLTANFLISSNLPKMDYPFNSDKNKGLNFQPFISISTAYGVAGDINKHVLQNQTVFLCKFKLNLSSSKNKML